MQSPSGNHFHQQHHHHHHHYHHRHQQIRRHKYDATGSSSGSIIRDYTSTLALHRIAIRLCEICCALLHRPGASFISRISRLKVHNIQQAAFDSIKRSQLPAPSEFGRA
ncbi:unnamed protein product [Ceratitis capitata]|uniref:(Mediterranean fruit fly) hypothetical protein n=1 Tax=Ceratitis capitata TaxID=7213 RepID=A0A811U282_CERCA|nr:unnamed protein product [Ceratitis capitata]